MVEYRRIRQAIERFRWADGGTVPVRTVLTDLVEPVEDYLSRLTGREARWRTLAELMRTSGKSRNYFEHRGATGKSRLEEWAEAGLAEQTKEGLWLVHPSVVDERRRAEREATAGSTPSAEAIAKRLLAKGQEG